MGAAGVVRRADQNTQVERGVAQTGIRNFRRKVLA